MAENERYLLRQSPSELCDDGRITAYNQTTLRDIVTYLDGTDGAGGTDRDLLKEFIKSRFSVGVRPRDEGNGYESFVHGKSAYAIDADLNETTPVHLLRMIVRSIATLTTGQGARYDYTSGDDEQGKPIRDEEAAALIGEHRDRGNYDRVVNRTDRLSVALGSSFVRVGWRSGGLSYEAVPIYAVEVGYGDQVAEGDTLRAVDMTDIEDASYVAVATTSVASNTDSTRWCTYVAACGEYPMGRCVVYDSDDAGSIPDVGNADVIEEWLSPASGEPANPLTWLRTQDPDLCAYEYPLAMLHGLDVGCEDLLPQTGESLYHDCLEVDCLYSQLATAAAEKAAGLLVFADPGNVGAPNTIKRHVLLHGAGNSTQEVSRIEGAGDVEQAARVVEKIAGTIAESYNVPAHEVLIDSGGQAESGVSLKIKNEPKLQQRAERIKINEAAIGKIFDIERAYLEIFGDGETISAEVTQQWFPGEITEPRNDVEFYANLKARKELGLIDYVGALREEHDLDTIDAAIELANEIAQRQADPAIPQWPAAQQPAQKAGGIRARLGVGTNAATP